MKGRLSQWDKFEFLAIFLKAKGGEYEIRWAQVLVQVSSGILPYSALDSTFLIFFNFFTPPSYYQIRHSNRIFSAWCYRCESWWWYKCVNSLAVWWMCDKASYFLSFDVWLLSDFIIKNTPFDLLFCNEHIFNQHE